MLWGQNGKHFGKKWAAASLKEGFQPLFPLTNCQHHPEDKNQPGPGSGKLRRNRVLSRYVNTFDMLNTSLCSVSETKTSHTNPLAQR